MSAGKQNQLIQVCGTITFTAYGQPKPKGSMRHVGNGRMIEQLTGSKPWRETVKYAALDAHSGPPLTGPVVVTATITVTKPKSAPKTRRTWPATRSSGDIDKHARNLLDALVDASVIGDDSQVVQLVINKTYPGEGAGALDRPGVYVVITAVQEQGREVA